MASAKVVLNMVDVRAWRDVERFIGLEYRIPVVACVPLADGCWRALEMRHSLVPFTATLRDRRRYGHAHGDDCWRTRQALEELVQMLALPHVTAMVTAAAVKV
jgi:hypothetical protein